MRARWATALLLLAIAPAACGDDGAGSSGSPPGRGTLLLATTTSTRDSGLLDELLQSFERRSGCTVEDARGRLG